MNPEVRVETIPWAMGRAGPRPRSGSGGRGGGCERQLRDPLRAQRGLSREPHPARLRRGHPDGGPGCGLRPERPRVAVLPVPLRRHRGSRGTLRPGRGVRSGDGDRRDHPGRGGGEARGRPSVRPRAPSPADRRPRDGGAVRAGGAATPLAPHAVGSGARRGPGRARRLRREHPPAVSARAASPLPGPPGISSRVSRPRASSCGCAPR